MRDARKRRVGRNRQRSQLDKAAGVVTRLVVFDWYRERVGDDL